VSCTALVEFGMTERQPLTEIVAQLISDYLGPAFPRPTPQSGSALNSAATGKIATLKALRDNIALCPNNFIRKRDLLVWQLREAIRTEFFQIHYPKPPTPKLLKLVITSEATLSDLEASQRPIYFPGARVAVPTEVGTHRAATTLQLRFKPHQQKTITEVLLHLDGPSGGSFQWVPSKILMLLSSCVPIPNPNQPPDARTQTPKALTSRASSTASRRKSVSTPVSGGASANGNSRTSRIRSRKSESRTNSRAHPTTSLPTSFLPRALRSTSPPPKKRLRSDFQSPVSYTTGALRKTLNAWSYCSEVAGSKIPINVQNSILENTLCIQSIIGRRRNMSLGGIIQYCVNWSGTPISAASWESRDALIRDVPGLVLAFDTSHPEEPSVCQVADGDAPKEEALGGGGKAKEVIDSTTNFPIPEYLDTPVLELNFSGMQLQIRQGSKGVLFIDGNEAKLDRKKKLAQFKSENPSGWEKVFLNNSTKFQEEPKMELISTSLKIKNADVLPVLQKSIDSHTANKRRPISYPKALGQVKSVNNAAIIPMDDILNSPDSWESYLGSLGLQCRDWHRSLLPHMPGVDKEAVQYMSNVAEMRWQEEENCKNERDRKCRVDIEEYTSKSRGSGRNSVEKKESRSVKSAEKEDIVDRSIVAAAMACAQLL